MYAAQNDLLNYHGLIQKMKTFEFSSREPPLGGDEPGPYVAVVEAIEKASG